MLYKLRENQVGNLHQIAANTIKLTAIAHSWKKILEIFLNERISSIFRIDADYFSAMVIVIISESLKRILSKAIFNAIQRNFFVQVVHHDE